MTELLHHELAPSSAARNVQCPGSTRAEQRFPEIEEDDEDARNGTAAHWAFQQILTTGEIPQVGDRAENGVILDADMIEAAHLVADDALAVCKQYATDPRHLQVEKRVQIHWWFGTPDVALIVLLPNGQLHIFVWDFKYGHRYVSEFENWQCMDYVFGLVSTLPREIDWARVSVHIRIVQPRCYIRGGALREWAIPLNDLRAHFNLRLARAEEAVGENPRFIPGEECRDCRARHGCPALQTAAHAVMDHISREQPMGLRPEVIGWEYAYTTRSLQILKAYHEGLEQQAAHMIKTGQVVPGVMSVTGAGRTKWTVPAKQAIDMAKMMGVDISKPPEALTPLQAKKAGLDAGFVDGLSRPDPGKTSIVVDDGSLARRVGFGKS